MLPTLSLILLSSYVCQQPGQDPFNTQAIIESRAKSAPGAIEWLRSNAVKLQSADLTSEEVESFIQKVGEFKVLGLGEATHGDHESQAYKSSMIKYLIQRKLVTVVGLECNRAAGVAFDRYVNFGEGDLAKIIHSKSFFRIWQTEEFSNMILWLRAYVLATKQPVRVIGVDCQDAQIDVLVPLDFLKKVSPSHYFSYSRELAPLIHPPKMGLNNYAWVVATKKPEFQKVQKSLHALLNLLKARSSKWSRIPRFEEAQYAAMVAAQDLDAFDLEAGGVSDKDMEKAPMSYYSRRDISMANNLVFKLGANDRAVVWAHNLHVVGGIPREDLGRGFRTFGTTLRSILNSNYVSVGAAYTSGRFLARNGSNDTSGGIVAAIKTDMVPFDETNDRKQDLGGLLNKVGTTNYFVDIRNPGTDLKLWGIQPSYRGEHGSMLSKQGLADDKVRGLVPLFPSYDFLFYFERLTPSRLWPK
jgi:erythromycin esterase